jgi:genome maintenance exonuclease 1
MSFKLTTQIHREKTFTHLPVNLGYDDLPTTTVNGRRQYVLPNGHSYPSITTVLGHGKNLAIEAWKKRVGNEEAERVSRVACTRGTSLHTLVERYINNEAEVLTGNEMPDAIAMFRTLAPEINSRIGSVYLQEKALYSAHLRVAGRTDLIAEFDGRLSVIDIKSSSRVKSKRDIKNYFMQEAAYAIMFEERTGIPVDRLVTLMAVNERSTPLVFVERRDDWTSGLLKAIHEYEESIEH